MDSRGSTHSSEASNSISNHNTPNTLSTSDTFSIPTPPVTPSLSSSSNTESIEGPSENVLSAQKNKPLEIDPLFMTEIERRILRAHMEVASYSFINVFPKNYIFKQQGGCPAVKLVNENIIRWEEGSGKTLHKGYQVFSFADKLNNGSYGVILDSYSLDIELKHIEKDYVLKWQKHQDGGDFKTSTFYQNVYKIAGATFLENLSLFEPENFASQRTLTHEGGFARRAHLDVKPYVIFPSATPNIFYSIHVMGFIKGKTLLHIINHDIAHAKRLSLSMRYALTRMLFSHYITNILDQGLIHFDFKLDNVLVDIDWKNKVIRHLKFIDFGLCQDANSLDQTFRGGNDMFSASEVLDDLTPISQLCDPYSLAMMAALIWGADVEEKDSNGNYKHFTRDATFPNIFNGIHGLEDEEKIFIKSALLSFVKFKPEERFAPFRDSTAPIMTPALLKPCLEKFIKQLDACEAGVLRSKSVPIVAKQPRHSYTVSTSRNGIFTPADKVSVMPPKPDKEPKRGCFSCWK